LWPILGAFGVIAGVWIAGYVKLRNEQGELLPLSVQETLSRFFPELDLSKVKVIISELAQALPTKAGAFTPLWDLIVIRPVLWRPDTVYGLGLIGNELTHIRQWKRLGMMFLPMIVWDYIGYGDHKGPLERESTEMMQRIIRELRGTL